MPKIAKQEQIFATGSTTFHNSTRFFPRDIREEVTILYAFLREVDNFVDQKSQDKAGFWAYKKEYEKALKSGSSQNQIINSFIELQKKRSFDPRWTEAFFRSMESDLSEKTYHTYKDTMQYIYGSAEVIGMFMSNIMRLDEIAGCYAALLGRAYQLINFIRDIGEDLELGRTYFPVDELKLFALDSLKPDYTRSHALAFEAFIRAQINRFKMYLEQAHIGFRYMPRSYALPIKTASDMFVWTADKIASNPFVVYESKVKPSKTLIVFTGLKNRFLKHNEYLSLD